MNSSIALAERFTDVELADMFNIDLTPDAPHNEGDRRPLIEEPYVFNDIKTQMWSLVDKPPTRGVAAALQSDDNLKPEISSEPPGSGGRVEALAAHYNGVDWDTKEGEENRSAFYT